MMQDNMPNSKENSSDQKQENIFLSPDIFMGIDSELERIASSPRFSTGSTLILGKPFKYHDGASFAVTYKELFINEIYRFNPSNRVRTIIDCGANMGLSVLYFADSYKEHTILAFEPDKDLFKLLEENVVTFGLKNVKLFNKAVWDKSETLRFFTDGGMGGRVQNAYVRQEPKLVEAIPLLDFLTNDVDFLKIDIEGAEDRVLRSCRSKLKNVKHIFFEYHGDIRKRQTLHELLQMFQEEGFHYHIKESAARRRPFIDTDLICEAYDMAINVFCYREMDLSLKYKIQSRVSRTWRKIWPL